jgi:hypothetical protein
MMVPEEVIHGDTLTSWGGKAILGKIGRWTLMIVCEDC